MTQAITLARPYARAVFTMAREQQRMPQWSNLIGWAARAVSEPAVQSLLGDPRISPQALADLVVPPGDIDPLFQQFLSVLAENRRMLVCCTALGGNHRRFRTAWCNRRAPAPAC